MWEFWENLFEGGPALFLFLAWYINVMDAAAILLHKDEVTFQGAERCLIP